MTLPVTLADAPALPRAAEAMTAAPSSGDGVAFAKALAETMAVPAGTVPASAVGAAVVNGAGAPEASMDAEAMLADLNQRAIGLGDASVPDVAPALPHAEGEAAPVHAEMNPLLPVAAAGPDEAEVAPETPLPTEAGSEAPEAITDEEGRSVAADIPLALPLTALLAAALPAAPSGDAVAPTVQPGDAAVEAARRAMAATIAMPLTAKAEKDAKGPLDGPDAAEPALEGEIAMGEKDATGPAKAAVGAEARSVAAQVIPMAAVLRNGAEARRDASAEVALAATGGEAASGGGSTAATGSAPQQTGAQAMGHLPSGPIQTTRPGWEAALADRIAAELSSDGKEIELDLAPEKLGHLKIRLEVVDGLAQVRIVTETPEAARLFQQNEHRLSENLSRAGLSLGGQEAASRDAQNNGAQGQNGQTPGERGARMRGMDVHFDRQGTAALAEMAGRTGRGLVNLIA